MMVKYLENLSQKLQPASCSSCRACGLYLNQLPIVEMVEEAQIFWVGLSAVKMDLTNECVPLAMNTRSGALINTIENPLRESLSFYKTNLVKCLPLGKEKIRYPLKKEMERCYPNFENEVAEYNPKIVFLLGKQVASFVIKQMIEKEVNLSTDFCYEQITVQGITFVPVHHPSYILVYKRKMINDYIDSIRHIARQA